MIDEIDFKSRAASGVIASSGDLDHSSPFVADAVTRLGIAEIRSAFVFRSTSIFTKRIQVIGFNDDIAKKRRDAVGRANVVLRHRRRQGAGDGVQSLLARRWQDRM